MVEDSFKLLEDRIRRAAERLKELQSETQSLRGELAKAQKRATEAEERATEAAKQLEGSAAADGSRGETSMKADSLARQVKALQREREEIRSRLGRLVELLDGLEQT
jgi:chromosome segregation ATPase